MRKDSTRISRASSTKKAPARSPKHKAPVLIAAPDDERAGPPLPPFDWESYLTEKAARDAARFNGDPTERAEEQAIITNGLRRKLKQWRALGNLFADALTSPDTPRAAQKALLDDIIDPLMDRVQINFTDPELLREFYPILCFLDEEDYRGSFHFNLGDDEDEEGGW